MNIEKKVYCGIGNLDVNLKVIPETGIVKEHDCPYYNSSTLHSECKADKENTQQCIQRFRKYKELKD